MDEDELDRKGKKQNRIRNRRMKEYRHIYKGKISDTHRDLLRHTMNLSSTLLRTMSRRKTVKKKHPDNPIPTPDGLHIIPEDYEM